MVGFKNLLRVFPLDVFYRTRDFAVEFEADEIKGLLAKALEKMRGASYADGRYFGAESDFVAVSKSAKKAEQAESHGIAFRAFANGNWGYCSTTDTNAKAVFKAAQTALRAAKAIKSKGATVLAEVPVVEKDVVVLGKQDASKMPIDRKLALAEEQYDNCVKSDRRICDARTVLMTGESCKAIVTSEGSSVSKRVGRTRCYSVAVAREADKQRQFVGSEGIVGGMELLKEYDWTAKSQAVCKRAIELLSSVKTPVGQMPVVFRGSGGGSGLIAHEAVGHAVEGDYAMMDRSYFNGKIGKQVAATGLSLVDSGIGGSGYGAIYFDDEAVEAKKTYLIKDGIFKTFMLDRSSAAFFDLKPTGNARAQDHNRRVYVRMRNTYIEPGDWKPEEIVEETKKGVLCNHWKAGIEDPAGGSFQLFFADGYLIENGELTESLYNISTSQTATLDCLKAINAIGNDLCMDAGGCGKGHADYVHVGSGGPTLRIDNIIVGGA